VATVVQSGTIPDAFSGNMGANATSGNTVFLVVVTYNTANDTISSSSPVYAGSAVPGAAEILTGSGVLSAFQSGQGVVYVAIWMLPNVSGGSEAVGVTVTNGLTSGIVGLLYYEVAATGRMPITDKKNSGSAADTTAVTSGASGNITQGPEFVIGASAVWNGIPLPGSGWTSQGIGGSSPYSAAAGYQLPASSGSSYTWSGTSGTAGPWAAGVATLYATPSGILQPRAVPGVARRRRPYPARPFFTPVAGANASGAAMAGTVPVLMTGRTELISRRDGRVVQG